MTGTETAIPIYGLDGNSILAIKDANINLEFPFFLLKAQQTPLLYDPDASKTHYKDVNGNELIIYPHPKYGYPTQYDKHLLIYIISQLTEHHNRTGGDVPRKFNIYVKDFLRFVGRSPGGERYRQINVSIERLRGCLFTVIKRSRNRIVSDEKFSLIANANANKKSNEGFNLIQITLNDWLVDIITDKQQLLTLHPDYFTLTKPLEQRLYEIGRKFCGKKECWSLPTHKLLQRVGSDANLKTFHQDLKHIIYNRNGELLNYRINLDSTNSRRQEFWWYRSITRPTSKPKGQQLFSEPAVKPRQPKSPPPKAVRAKDIEKWEPDNELITELRKIGDFDRKDLVREYHNFVKRNGQLIRHPERHFRSFAETHISNLPEESNNEHPIMYEVMLAWWRRLPEVKKDFMEKHHSDLIHNEHLAIRFWLPFLFWRIHPAQYNQPPREFSIELKEAFVEVLGFKTDNPDTFFNGWEDAFEKHFIDKWSMFIIYEFREKDRMSLKDRGLI